MIIDMTQSPTRHCWVVRMDALEVSFNTREDAQAFVGQLKARIEAPHVWPIPDDRGISKATRDDRQRSTLEPFL